MRKSTVVEKKTVDVPRYIRAHLAMEGVNATDMSRRYGGAVSYWTRRMNGETALSLNDVLCFAEAGKCHPAELLGGRKPTSDGDWSVIREYQMNFTLAA